MGEAIANADLSSTALLRVHGCGHDGSHDGKAGEASKDVVNRTDAAGLVQEGELRGLQLRRVYVT